MRENLKNDLTKGFIQYQWRLDNPFPSPTEHMANLRDKYLTDPMFKTKVDNLVVGVMRIIEEHCTYKEK